MNSEHKKALLLIKAIIFYYHKLDQGEIDLLQQTALDLDAHEELAWTYEFIDSDISTSTSRAKLYLKENPIDSSNEEKFQILKSVWIDTEKKGYISEIEAVTMLKISKDWGIEAKLMALARGNR